MTAGQFNHLLSRIKSGDMSALQPIYLAYYKSMCNQALYIVHNRADAEDVASDAMMKLVHYAQKPDGEYIKDGGAFLYTLTRNTALDFLRKQKPTADIDEMTIASDDDTDKLLLSGAIQNLPEQDIKIAQMFYYYDCKIKQIAKETGMTVSAVKWHLSEIRKKLYEILKTD